MAFLLKAECEDDCLSSESFLQSESCSVSSPCAGSSCTLNFVPTSSVSLPVCWSPATRRKMFLGFSIEFAACASAQVILRAVCRQ